MDYADRRYRERPAVRARVCSCRERVRWVCHRTVTIAPTDSFRSRRLSGDWIDPCETDRADRATPLGTAEPIGDRRKSIRPKKSRIRNGTRFAAGADDANPAGLAAVVVSSVVGNLACDGPVVDSSSCGAGGSMAFGGVRIAQIDKVDLFIVVDDSPSMADKQAELARQMPELLSSLMGPFPGGRPDVLDVHVGVITSSLGSHGTSACAGKDDRGRLLPRARRLLVPHGGDLERARLGVRSAPDPAAPVQRSCRRRAAPDRHLVRRAERGRERLRLRGDVGGDCYHFLVDPAPYTKAEVTCSGDACGNNKIIVSGVDNEHPRAAQGVPPPRLAARGRRPLRRERRLAQAGRSQLAAVGLRQGPDAARLGELRQRARRLRARDARRVQAAPRRVQVLLVLRERVGPELQRPVGDRSAQQRRRRPQPARVPAGPALRLQLPLGPPALRRRVHQGSRCSAPTARLGAEPDLRGRLPRPEPGRRRDHRRRAEGASSPTPTARRRR